MLAGTARSPFRPHRYHELDMPTPGPLEIIIVLIIVLVIFGPKRLPELGKSMGKGIREFKGSLSTEDKDEIPADRSSKPAEIVDGEVVTERKA